MTEVTPVGFLERLKQHRRAAEIEPMSSRYHLWQRDALLVKNADKLEALIEAAKEYEAAWHAGMAGFVHNFTEAEVRAKMARRDVAFMDLAAALASLDGENAE